MFALNMPEGTGLMAYLEKGEKGLLRSQAAASKSVYGLFVEKGKLVFPPDPREETRSRARRTLGGGRQGRASRDPAQHPQPEPPLYRADLPLQPGLQDLYPEHLERADGPYGPGDIRPPRWSAQAVSPPRVGHVRRIRRTHGPPKDPRHGPCRKSSRPPRRARTTNGRRLPGRHTLVEGLFAPERLRHALDLPRRSGPQRASRRSGPEPSLSRVMENVERLARKDGRGRTRARDRHRLCRHEDEPPGRQASRPAGPLGRRPEDRGQPRPAVQRGDGEGDALPSDADPGDLHLRPRQDRTEPAAHRRQ